MYLKLILVELTGRNDSDKQLLPFFKRHSTMTAAALQAIQEEQTSSLEPNDEAYCVFVTLLLWVFNRGGNTPISSLFSLF